MNKVELSGRLTKDPVVRSSQARQQEQGSMNIAHFTLAVNRRSGKTNDPNAQTADFLNCVAFGKLADTISNYTRKGSKLLIVGHLQSGKYENKNGQTIYTTDVIVDEMEFGETRAESEAHASGQAHQASTAQSSAGQNYPGAQYPAVQRQQNGYQQQPQGVPQGNNFRQAPVQPQGAFQPAQPQGGFQPAQTQQGYMYQTGRNATQQYAAPPQGYPQDTLPYPEGIKEDLPFH